MIQSLCVFCGSNEGNDPAAAVAARDLGRLLAESETTLVYGGGRVGLMGVIADAVLAAGGRAVGVIPRNLLDREVGHRGLTRMHVVESMHERKALMASLSDAFVALPGGLGTLEEIFEVWTWGQLGIHRKPIGFLDVSGYYAALMTFLDHAVTLGFIRPQHRSAAIVDSEPKRLLERLRRHQPPEVQKWLDLQQT